MTYGNAMTTTPQHMVPALAGRSNAYVPPAAAKRRPAAAAPAIEAPPESAAGEPVPIFKVGYRKVRATSIVFPDRRIRAVTPKIAALETIAEHQELLLRFSDPKEAERQPLKLLNQAAGIMREIVPFMVPNVEDREFLLSKFDDENVEETELITQLLKAFAYLMGTLSASKAAERTPAVPRIIDETGHDTDNTDVAAPEGEPVAAAPEESEESNVATATEEYPRDLDVADPAEDADGGRFGITATQHDPTRAYVHKPDPESDEPAAE